MAILDPVKNFAKVTVSIGYDASATSIALSSGQGSKLPDPATDGAFNLVWWNATDYNDPSDDPNVEIVRCTGRSTDTLTVTRAQESTSASTKNTSGKTYKMILAPTAKLVTDIGTNYLDLSATQSVTGSKTFTDSAFTIQDNSDTTKKFQFQASGISASTTRTYTVPNANTTIVGQDTTDTLSNKTLTAPKIANGGYIADANGNEQVVFNTTSSATTYVDVTNAATGTTGPLVKAAGETNVDLRLGGSGTGKIHDTTGRYGDLTSDSDGATITFNMATSNLHTVTLGGNRTLALSNVAVGQCFILRLVQDGSGSRTVTWFSTIKWAGGSAPTLTTTANKTDVLGFICTSSGNYDGFVVGQNL